MHDSKYRHENKMHQDHSMDDNSGEPCNKRNAKYEFITAAVDFIIYQSVIVYKITILYHVFNDT